MFFRCTFFLLSFTVSLALLLAALRTSIVTGTGDGGSSIGQAPPSVTSLLPQQSVDPTVATKARGRQKSSSVPSSPAKPGVDLVTMNTPKKTTALPKVMEEIVGETGSKKKTNSPGKSAKNLTVPPAAGMTVELSDSGDQRQQFEIDPTDGSNVLPNDTESLIDVKQMGDDGGDDVGGSASQSKVDEGSSDSSAYLPSCSLVYL